MQKETLDFIKAALEKKKKTVSISFQWANTGTLRVIDGLKTRAQLSFDFQHTYASFKAQDLIHNHEQQHHYCEYSKADYQVRIESIVQFLLKA